MREKIVLLTVALIMGSARAQVTANPMARPVVMDDVVFSVVDFDCDVTVFGVPHGVITPARPRTIKLERGKEHLVECQSTSFPVKLYARYHLFTAGSAPDGPLPANVELRPVAVLPNVVNAASGGKVVARTIADAQSFTCDVNTPKPAKKFQRHDTGKLIAGNKNSVIPHGTTVVLTAVPPQFCVDTNLVAVKVGSGSLWYKNTDFEFLYNDKAIPLYPPSRDSECCWID